MWLSLVFAGLVLVIAYLQSTQGLFSALLMTVLTVCCCGAAFGTYEWVAVNWVAGLWRPDYAHPITLAAIFGIPLLGLRLGLDYLVQRSAILPVWIDRAGATLCGLVTGLIVAGTGAFCLLMIPFGPSVMGFARVDVTVKNENGSSAPPPDLKTVEHDLYLTPDHFAVGVASMLSEGVFSGSANFRDVHPDLVRASGWINAVPSEVSRYVPPGSISLVRTESVPFVYRRIPPAAVARRQRGQQQAQEDPPTFEAIPPEGGLEFHMVRVALKRAALDARKSHLFTLRQFQLVGQENGEEIYKRYHAVAIQQDIKPGLQEMINRHIRFHRVGSVDWPVIDAIYTTRSGNNAEVEVVFELPIGFQPAFIQYKRSARAEVSFGGATSAQADGGASAPQVTPGAQRSSASTHDSEAPRGGRVRRFTSRSGESIFGDALPATLKAYRKLKNASISRGALADGHLVAYADEQDDGKDVAVRRFKVPQGKRLLQLSTEFLKARSTLGKAIGFAVTTLQNYFVEDAKGNRYELVGKYAIAEVHGREVIEIQYFSNKAGSIGQIGKFEKIRDDDLKGDYQYALLFLVEPGARITSFSTGGSASRRDDLADQNLVAPK